MKTAHELLTELDNKRVRLVVEPHESDWQQSRLQVSGNRDALTPAIVADLRRLKITLLAVLLACDCRECQQRTHLSQSALALPIDRHYTHTHTRTAS